MIDKAPDFFTDEKVSGWKTSHQQRIAELFGAVRYEDRQSARLAIDPLLYENRAIFDEYNPSLSYKSDPEASEATTWKRLVVSKIIPNNRRIEMILKENMSHLTKGEKGTFGKFRLHIGQLEARHLEDVPGPTTTFPVEMDDILMEEA